MANLAAIQTTLDNDNDEKMAFIKSPVHYLEQKGVKVTEQDKENIHHIIEKNHKLLSSGISVSVSIG